MSVKYGCTVWTMMEPDYHAPYNKAICRVAEAGFDGIELMVDDKREVEGYWTGEKIRETRELLDETGLELIQVCMFQNMIGGLASLDPALQDEAVSNFRQVCRLAKSLGTDTVNFTAPYPEEAIRVRTTATLPEYYYLNLPDMVQPGGETRAIEGWRFDAQFRLYFCEGFRWEDYWENFLDGMEKIDRAAGEEGVVCRVENRYNTLLPHTDSFLRMFRRFSAKHVSVTFNTAQAFIQREILPWAVHKYGKHLTHVRACDGDGLACYNLPPGQGICDWAGILEALRETGYNGYVSFEWLNDAEKEENAREALEYLKRIERRI